MTVFGRVSSYGDCSQANYIDNSIACRTVWANRAGSTQYRVAGSHSSTESGLSPRGTGGAPYPSATPGMGWNSTGTNPNPTAPGTWFAGTGDRLGEMCMSRTAVVDANNSTMSVWPPLTMAPGLVMAAA